MACPTETTFATLQTGRLDPIEAAALHRHLDECSCCLELAGILGSIDPGRVDTAASISATTTPKRRALSFHRFHATTGTLATLGVTAVSNLHLIATAFSTARRAVGGMSGSPSAHVSLASTLPFGLSVYLLALGFGGFVACCAAIGGLEADCLWSERLVRRCAIISMFTVVLVPLGVCLLLALRRGRPVGAQTPRFDHYA